MRQKFLDHSEFRPSLPAPKPVPVIPVLLCARQTDRPRKPSILVASIQASLDRHYRQGAGNERCSVSVRWLQVTRGMPRRITYGSSQSRRR